MTTHFMYMSHLSVLLLVLFYLPVCLGVLWFINFLVRKMSFGKVVRAMICIVFTVPMFLLPTWDAILGKYYLDQLCKRDGGFSSNKPLFSDGFYIPSNKSRFTAQKILDRGFVFLEMKGLDNRFIRYTLDIDGDLSDEFTEELKSTYILNSDMQLPFGEYHGLMYTLDRHYVANFKTGELLREFKNYYFRGGYIDRILMSAYGVYVVGCTDTDSSLNRFSTENLIMPEAMISH